MANHSQTATQQVVKVGTLETASLEELVNIFHCCVDGGYNESETIYEKELLTSAIKNSSRYKQLKLVSPMDTVLFCFDSQSRFVSSFCELPYGNYMIELDSRLSSGYKNSSLTLSFNDKRKLLYQELVSNDLFGVAEVPWWALTLPQATKLAKERDKNITYNKVKQLQYPHSWLASKIRASRSFREEFGSPSNFDFMMFSFSVEEPFKCSWTKVKTDEHKQFVGQVKEIMSIKKSLQSLAHPYSEESVALSESSGPSQPCSRGQINVVNTVNKTHQTKVEAKRLNFEIHVEPDFSLVPSILFKGTHIMLSLIHI